MICLCTTTFVWLNVITLVGKIYPKIRVKPLFKKAKKVHFRLLSTGHATSCYTEAEVIIVLRIAIYSIANITEKTSTESLYFWTDIDYFQQWRWKILVKKRGEFLTSGYLVLWKPYPAAGYVDTASVDCLNPRANITGANVGFIILLKSSNRRTSFECIPEYYTRYSVKQLPMRICWQRFLMQESMTVFAAWSWRSKLLVWKCQLIWCRYGTRPETEIILSLKVWLKFVLELDSNMSWPWTEIC